MLSNPLYNGILISRKTETQDFLTGKRVSTNHADYTFKLEHLKIIDDKTFKKASDILKTRSQSQKRSTPLL